MIADATTKWMRDQLLTWWFRTGHWEPVGGYAELSDDEAFVLLLDPARHKCVWHWVPLRLVVGCVCTTNSRGEARGYLRLARG